MSSNKSNTNVWQRIDSFAKRTLDVALIPVAIGIIFLLMGGIIYSEYHKYQFWQEANALLQIDRMKHLLTDNNEQNCDTVAVEVGGIGLPATRCAKKQTDDTAQMYLVTTFPPRHLFAVRPQDRIAQRGDELVISGFTKTPAGDVVKISKEAPIDPLSTTAARSDTHP